MKRLAILLIACGVCTAGYCQSRTGAYNRVVTDRWQVQKDVSVATTVWHNGTIRVSQHLIIIDSASSARQVYTILNRSEVNEYEYEDTPGNYGIQFLTVAMPSKVGLKIIKAYLLLGIDKRTITALVLQPAKHTDITYTFNTD